jgi:nucleoside-diphosphate-sugar epimerase
MTVLITGGCGYIGSQFIRDCASKFKDIRIIDNLFSERYVSLFNLPTKAKYEFIMGDIRNKEDVKKALKGVDIVFDLAGITNAPLSFERKKLTFDVNYGGLKNLIEESIKNNVKRYIYVSSCSIYGPTKKIVKEEYDHKPASPYGESKLMAEKECLKVFKENGLNATVLRIGTVYGYTIGIRFDTVINKFVFLACTHQPLTVYEDAWDLKRPYLHVKDAIRSFLFAIDNDKSIGEIFNVVGGNASVREIVNLIKKYIPDVEIKLTKTKYLNQLSFAVDSSKIDRLGFKIMHNIDEGIKEMVDKFKPFL